MNKFYVNSRTVAELLQNHRNFLALRAILEATMKVANGRTLVLPSLKGEHLPQVFGRVPNAEVLPRPKFERERVEAFAALRDARDAYEARQMERRDRHAAVFLGVKEVGHVISVEEFAERNRARLARDARVRQNREARNAECQERRGSSGGKKGK